MCVDFSVEDELEYVLADETNVYKGKIAGEYKQDESEQRYWEEFGEYYLPAINDIVYSPGKIKSDYAEVRFGKHYYFNLAIRQGFNQFKVELKCNNSHKGNGLLSNLFKDKESICEQIRDVLEGEYEINLHDRNITLTFSGDIYNFSKWDTYMVFMKNAIIFLYDLIAEEKYRV